MSRKTESVTILLTTPSTTSDEDASDIEENSFGSSKRMKTDIDFGSAIQIENNKRQLKEDHPIKNVVVPTTEKSNPNIVPTKLLPTDPILILRDRPNKPALKSCNNSSNTFLTREVEKDVKKRLDSCDCLADGRSIDCLNSTCHLGRKVASINCVIDFEPTYYTYRNLVTIKYMEIEHVVNA